MKGWKIRAPVGSPDIKNLAVNVPFSRGPSVSTFSSTVNTDLAFFKPCEA